MKLSRRPLLPAKPKAAEPDRKQPVILASGSRYFAFGLDWFTPTGRLQAAINKEARGTSLRYVAKRPKHGQYAPVWAKERDAGKVFGAAATIADRNPGTFIGAWHLDETRVWVLVVGPKGILPDGDQVFDDIDAAKSFVDRQLSNVTFNTAYLPEHWTQFKGQFEPLKNQLAGRLAGQLVPPTNPALKIAAAAGLVAIGLSVWKAVFPSTPEYYVEDADGNLVPPPPPPPPPPPMAYWTPLSYQLDACLAHMTAPLGDTPGYVTTIATCDGQQVTFEVRSGSEFAREVAQQIWQPSLTRSDAITTEAIKLPPLFSLAADRDFPTEEDVRAQLLAFAQASYGEMTVQPKAPPSLPNADQALFAEVLFKLSTSAPPPVWWDFAGALPTARLVSFSFDQNTFTLEGRIYVAR